MIIFPLTLAQTLPYFKRNLQPSLIIATQTTHKRRALRTRTHTTDMSNADLLICAGIQSGKWVGPHSCIPPPAHLHNYKDGLWTIHDEYSQTWSSCSNARQPLAWREYSYCAKLTLYGKHRGLNILVAMDWWYNHTRSSCRHQQRKSFYHHQQRPQQQHHHTNKHPVGMCGTRFCELRRAPYNSYGIYHPYQRKVKIIHQLKFSNMLLQFTYM